jgi:putative tricarboxylic transport membrane protein
MRRPSKNSKPLAVTAIAIAAGVALAACGPASSSVSGSASGSGSTPKNVQFIVDTGPGGGSDLFARELIKLTQAQKLAPNWPVVSQTAGGGLGAMAFLKGKNDSPSYISAFTSKWIIAGLSTPGAPAQLSELTPIAELADETQVIAAPASAPYDTMSGFVAAAKAKPGKLVQTGGSINSVDNLIALQIEKQTGTKWKYLSFDDGGPRITALLRGDAQIDVGAESDFHDQIAAGKLKLIGVVGDTQLPDYPNVTTLSAQGIDLGTLPDQLQFRGIAGPPGMPASAVTYYQNILSKISNSPDWQTYLKSQGLTAHYVTGSDLKTLLTTFTSTMTPLVAGLPKSG